MKSVLTDTRLLETSTFKDEVDRQKLDGSSPPRTDRHLTGKDWNCGNGSWKKP